jgi:hypothetical protein
VVQLNQRTRDSQLKNSSKNLRVDSFPGSGNYQTYSQNNYNNSHQNISAVNLRKHNTDSNRPNRIASRENPSRRSIIDQSGKPSHPHSMSIPQKMQKGQKMPVQSNNFNQTSTQGFFTDISSSNQNQEQKHMRQASQFTPQLTHSLKHTLSSNNATGNIPLNEIILQQKKSGPITQASHGRHTSIDQGGNKKMSV